MRLTLTSLVKGLSAAGILAAAAMGAQGAQAAETVTFIPGTYSLAETNLGSPVDTLVVTVSAGTASFVLSGADNATFTLPDSSTPTGGGGNPYYLISSSGGSASWDTTSFPYLVFWSTPSDGGLTADAVSDDSGPSDFNLFQSTAGTGQVFTVSGVPEPAAWTMMLVGVGCVGAMARSSRRSRLATTTA
jgi:hypothetical protein